MLAKRHFEKWIILTQKNKFNLLPNQFYLVYKKEGTRRISLLFIVGLWIENKPKYKIPDSRFWLKFLIKKSQFLIFL